MVDFTKRLSRKQEDKKIDPFEIYDSLDRRSVTGPLRPIQETILRQWHGQNRKEKDLVIKLHTGSGKTLIGLLILQSHLNDNSKPCLYICPNIYLSDQVCLDAKKFGIPFCIMGDDNEIPNSFIDGKKILITHSQKLFNGKTIFGLDNDYIECDSIIMDDSHACIDSIRNAFTINIKREHALFENIRQLLEEELINQGHGTYLEIKDGEYNSYLHIPYWSFRDKEEEILHLLSKYKGEKEILFAWPLLKDSLRNMQMHISGYGIEFSPYHIPIERFGTFHKANQRVLMSATTQDDSFFIKGLSFSKKAVTSPLEDQGRLWSGEKMLLIPSLICEDLDRDLIVSRFAKPSNHPFGTVAITPSFRKANQYESIGADIATHEDIFKKVQGLKTENFKNTLVLANRYDGIDLPDEACRILIIDSKPFFNSLSDKYEESCRVNSDMINIKLAQRVEQGLGRSVRGEKDYSVVILIGDDLVRFIKSSRTNKYFSDQTKKQIEIGMEIAEMAIEELDENNSSFKVISSLLDQAIVRRDGGWKAFYNEKMNEIKVTSKEYYIYDILEKERIAEEYLYSDNPERASETFQDIIDNHCTSESEKGWYLQQMARSAYFYSKSESNKIQKSAFSKNKQLLKPKEGISYKKVEFIDNNRIQNIIHWIQQFNSYDDLMISLNGLFSDLSFGMPAEKFEFALKEIGLALGLLSERPDKEHKTGPDNLWCGTENSYIIFECKSEAKEDRAEISKSEASQMNTHCGWFKDIYGSVSVKRILVIPTKDLSKLANFTHEVEIMRKGKLRILKQNVTSFFKEFKKYKRDTIKEETANDLLTTHKLHMSDLIKVYSEPYYKKK